jgi:three-Cys-motif partner protein
MSRPKRDQYEPDPDDGLPRGIVGAWSIDKHARLVRYVFASHGARRKFRQEYHKETTFIDLYCGPGRARVRETAQIIDGSAVAAAKTAARCTPYDKYVIGDIDSAFVDACSSRLEKEGVDSIIKLVGTAEETALEATRGLHRGGLHFAFVDPFNANLPFSVLATLGELNRMDQLIHFSISDFRRNLMKMKEDGRLDALAPKWQTAITKGMGINEQRRAIFEHWRRLLTDSLKYNVSDTIVRVVGPKGAELYWLIFASRHDLGGKLWHEISNIAPQPQVEMF